MQNAPCGAIERVEYRDGRRVMDCLEQLMQNAPCGAIDRVEYRDGESTGIEEE
jgi:hypothetical protein